MAGKVVRNCACPSCAPQNEASIDANSYCTSHFANGGLFYLCDVLGKTVNPMQDALASFFSKSKLLERSLRDFAVTLRTPTPPDLGCTEHRKRTSVTVLQFHVLLRFKFFLCNGLKEKRTKTTSETCRAVTASRENWGVKPACEGVSV